MFLLFIICSLKEVSLAMKAGGKQLIKCISVRGKLTVFSLVDSTYLWWSKSSGIGDSKAISQTLGRRGHTSTLGSHRGLTKNLQDDCHSGSGGTSDKKVVKVQS